MARKSPSNDQPLRLVVHVDPDRVRAEEPIPQLAAHLFDAGGRSIGIAPVHDGTAVFELAGMPTPCRLRVLIGPDGIDQDDVASADRHPEPDAAALLRHGAAEAFVEVGSTADPIHVHVTVESQVWHCWVRRCVVHGSVAKRLVSSGEVVDFPVPGATVHVWQVTPIRWVAERLTPVQLATLHEAMLNPQPLPPAPEPWQDYLPTARGTWGGVQLAVPQATVPPLDEHRAPVMRMRRASAQMGPAAMRRQLLALPDEVLTRLICWVFPRLVTRTEIAQATTDHCGHFTARLRLGCAQAANLYFSVTVDLWFGLELTIHEPMPVACHTYWGLPCGAEVTLLTTSPFAPLGPPCPPIDAPEGYVLVRALGNVPLSRIRGTSAALAATTTAANLGLVADEYGAGLDAPFGGTVLPRLEFDPVLRGQGRATYYRMSYRAGESGPFVPLTGSVDRKYNHLANAELVTSPYNLGPVVVGPPGQEVTNLFEIPPASPPTGSWVYPDPPIDLANAICPTAVLPTEIAGGSHGIHQLRVELFDAVGHRVDLAAEQIAFVVPTVTDPDGTIHTAPATDLGLVDQDGFVMSLHVDNRPTTASLGPVRLDGAAADDCGVFRYLEPAQGSVEVGWTASQPGDFALYSFTLTRATTALTPPTGSGRVGPATSPASTAMSVAALLTHGDGQRCDIAGFAEELRVYAMATDGWSRQSQYDSGPALAAFVLAPQAPS